LQRTACTRASRSEYLVLYLFSSEPMSRPMVESRFPGSTGFRVAVQTKEPGLRT
jgi:hypothetical protein